jgi:hypothetical protein
MQANGLAAPGTGTSSNPAPATLWAASFAVFTDGNGHQWTAYVDSLGYGTPVEQVDPLGDTSISEINSSGLDWLTADPLGRRNRYFFGSNGLPTSTVYADDYSSSGQGDPGMSVTYNGMGQGPRSTDRPYSSPTVDFVKGRHL